jgi:hypothetical protein
MVKTSSPLTQLSNPTPTNGGSKLPLVKSNSGSFLEDDVIQDYDYADLVDSKVDLKRLERSEAIKRMRANEEEIACQLCGKKLMNRVSETQDREMLEKIVDKASFRFDARKEMLGLGKRKIKMGRQSS